MLMHSSNSTLASQINTPIIYKEIESFCDFIESHQLNHTAEKLLRRLAFHAIGNQSEVIMLTVEQMASLVNVKPAAIQKALNILKTKRLIARKRRKQFDGVKIKENTAVTILLCFEDICNAENITTTIKVVKSASQVNKEKEEVVEKEISPIKALKSALKKERQQQSNTNHDDTTKQLTALEEMSKVKKPTSDHHQVSVRSLIDEAVRRENELMYEKVEQSRSKLSKSLFTKKRELPEKVINYFDSKLQHIATTQDKRELLEEVVFSATFGVFSAHAPLYAMNIALKLIRENKWRTPKGYVCL